LLRTLLIAQIFIETFEALLVAFPGFGVSFVKAYVLLVEVDPKNWTIAEGVILSEESPME
jgi:hypothetical protein